MYLTYGKIQTKKVLRPKNPLNINFHFAIFVNYKAILIIPYMYIKKLPGIMKRAVYKTRHSYEAKIVAQKN